MATVPPCPTTPALEQHIDAPVEIHPAKHQAYVNNLNAALEKRGGQAARSTAARRLNAVPEAVRTAVRNNGGGHWNHSLFWRIMGPRAQGAPAGGEPTGKLGEAITSAFGGFDKMKEQFGTAAAGRFGSGWAWLVNDGGKLSITSTPNQDNPLMDGTRADQILLGLDVWEHAYYLNYQNRRPDYVSAWWTS